VILAESSIEHFETHRTSPWFFHVEFEIGRLFPLVPFEMGVPLAEYNE